MFHTCHAYVHVQIKNKVSHSFTMWLLSAEALQIQVEVTRVSESLLFKAAGNYLGGMATD
jgi:hypothetical protein